MIDLILARHGESEYSARHLENGDPTVPVPLTPQGREQAGALGKALHPTSIELCVTSEFPRTIETAQIALSGRSVRFVVSPVFNDIRYGIFEGRPSEEYRAWAEQHSQWTPIPGGGESRAEVFARCAGGLRELLPRPEETILLVFHELLLAAVLAAVRGAPPPVVAHDMPYATPYTLSAGQIRDAADVLKRESTPDGSETP